MGDTHSSPAFLPATNFWGDEIAFDGDVEIEPGSQFEFPSANFPQPFQVGLFDSASRLAMAPGWAAQVFGSWQNSTTRLPAAPRRH